MPPYEESNNGYISGMKFSTVAHWASELDQKLKFQTFKNPKIADGGHLEKLKNGHISRTVWLIGA